MSENLFTLAILFALMFVAGKVAAYIFLISEPQILKALADRQRRRNRRQP